MNESFASGLAFFGGLALAMSATHNAFAQQPPAWSPQSFSSPSAQNGTAQQTDNIPVNTLRGPKTEETTQQVLRWRAVSSDARPTSDGKNFSNVMSSNANAIANPNPMRPADPKLVIQQPVATQVAESITIGPKTSFKLNPRRERESSNVESHTDVGQSEDSGVRLASHTSNGRETSKSKPSVSAGVWYDRNAANEPAKMNIQRTRFQEPDPENSSILPKAFGFPPAVSEEPPQLREDSTSEEDTGNAQVDEAQEIPNPFPNPRKPDSILDDSPSDATEPPPLSREKDKDRAPKPPRRPDRSSVDCDVIRQRAKDQQDISSIKVDSSPNYVEGYKSKNQKSQNTKQGFLDSAEIRTWYDYDGMVVAEGKLVDIARGMAIIECPDGSRVSSLLRKLSDADSAYISQAWGIPVTCSIEDRSFPSRDFVETTMTFKASGACHKPLYFEEVQLERYGHEWGPFAQPVLSTAHFFGNVAVLPYKMGIHPMNECQYSLGYYRPGSCAPWTIGPVPISLRGALNQAKFVTGAALAIP